MMYMYNINKYSFLYIINKMNYVNIPTMYNDLQFRSRLETQWCTFFNKFGI